ncbi:DUF2834 domain-containing protein [Marinobacter sp. F4218]|nr:DUF2834 domain-containing protein [Marinobacter sp. F4218]
MGFTFWVMAGAEQSLLAFGVQLMSSPDTAQVVIDLYILAGLACVWMYQDAKSRGKGLGYLVPFFILTAVFVSAGPLLYLVLRGGREPETEASKM